MTPTCTPERLDAAYRTALDALLKERHPEGYWVGELSTSALSTATGVMALHMVQTTLGHHDYASLIDNGLFWLAEHQNPDGGWGDTTKSFSNISTTMLCRAAFYLTKTDSSFRAHVGRAEEWLFSRHGNTPEALAEAVRQRYGKDRTFAVPILTTCALAGLVSWKEVPPLPFELACFPQSWFRFLRLHVVSYALPALIAIGQCIHHHKKPWNPLTKFIRWLARNRSLMVLEHIQPSNGGFLEATPLTSFVTLSLAAIGLADHPVARKGADFIAHSVRPDGSWPIDTNLSTWVTTLAINALAAAEELDNLDKKTEVRDWLLAQQFKERHPYTGAAPGGWAWTPLPGGVPDGDDTPGALMTTYHLACDSESIGQVKNGLRWLLALQNRNGGWPTFCRGWGHLPFDRSGADLTAHAIRAIGFWGERLLESWFKEFFLHGKHPPVIVRWSSDELGKAKAFLFWNLKDCFPEGLKYLSHTLRPDGSWLPLWFGNQHAPDDENPTYGTARVLAAYRDLGLMNEEPARRGVAWLVANQNDDGGWGGVKGAPSTMEETALAVEILVDCDEPEALATGERRQGTSVANASGSLTSAAVNKGLLWLVDGVERGKLHDPSPIGFYFAKLWYFEKLYPIIFSVAALGRARQKMRNLSSPE